MPKTHVVSYSELDTLRQCPHKHVLAYRRRWVRETESPALLKGTLWHEVMEIHYQTFMGKTPNQRSLDEAKAAVIAYLKPLVVQAELDNNNDAYDRLNLIWWMYDGYVDFHGVDPDWYSIDHTEQEIRVWLPTDSGNRSSFQLKMKIDLVVTDGRGKQWVVDHKSGRNLPHEKHLEINDQFGLYSWGMRQVGFPVLGSVHNAARTQRNKDDSREGQPLDTRFLRSPMYRTEEELDIIALEAYRTFRAGYSVKPEEAPRHPNEDTCGWRCDYTEPCLAGRKGLDEVQFLEISGFRRDPTRH